jgi:hypothetical protein
MRRITPHLLLLLTCLFISQSPYRVATTSSRCLLR